MYFHVAAGMYTVQDCACFSFSHVNLAGGLMNLRNSSSPPRLGLWSPLAARSTSPFLTLILVNTRGYHIQLPLFVYPKHFFDARPAEIAHNSLCRREKGRPSLPLDWYYKADVDCAPNGDFPMALRVP